MSWGAAPLVAVGRGNSQPARITKQSNGLLTYSAIEGSNAQQKDYTDFDSQILTFPEDLEVFRLHGCITSRVSNVPRTVYFSPLDESL